MEDAAEILDFETAAILRDEITALTLKLDKQIKLAKPKKFTR